MESTVQTLLEFHGKLDAMTTALESLFQCLTTPWWRIFSWYQPEPHLLQFHAILLGSISVRREQRSVPLLHSPHEEWRPPWGLFLASFALAWTNPGTSATPHMCFPLDSSPSDILHCCSLWPRRNLIFPLHTLISHFFQCTCQCVFTLVMYISEKKNSNWNSYFLFYLSYMCAIGSVLHCRSPSTGWPWLFS